MDALAGYAPDVMLRTVIAGFLGLVALSCGIALLLDVVRWMAGEKQDGSGREGVGPVVRALKDKVVLAVAIMAIAGSGATLATAAGQSAGSSPSSTITGQGPAGWMVDGTAAGSTATMGEALGRIAEASGGQSFEVAVQQDYEGRVGAGVSALADAADAAASGDVDGSMAAGAQAGADLGVALTEDMWLGDNAAGIRSLLSGNLLGLSLNSWREIANWINTYGDSYEQIRERYGGA